MKRAVARSLCAAPAPTTQRRGGMRYIPETEMRRPESSSYMYRAVQDWKPNVHHVAHSRGKELEGRESVAKMTMILVDSAGFRWPIRFTKRPLMRLWHLFEETDDDNFGLHPGGPTAQFNHNTGPYGRPRSEEICQVGNPSVNRCSNCAVLVPYEYLDAMDPPNKGETKWLQDHMEIGTINATANTRLACQVHIEDWMDGMTVVLPQTDSMHYQMYVQHGVDRESVNGMFTGRSPGAVEAESDGHHSYARHTGREKGLKERFLTSDGGNNPDSPMRTPSSVMTGLGSTGAQVPLMKTFWTRNVDDMIRHQDPSWKGRYEFLNK